MSASQISKAITSAYAALDIGLTDRYGAATKVKGMICTMAVDAMARQPNRIERLWLSTFFIGSAATGYSPVSPNPL